MGRENREKYRSADPRKVRLGRSGYLQVQSIHCRRASAGNRTIWVGRYGLKRSIWEWAG